jgi:phage terminase large subunit
LNQRVRVNDKYLPYLRDKSRHLALYGGGSSGKSVFAAQKVAIRTLTELGHKFLCLRKVGETVKESIFAELKSAINDTGCYNEFEINKTEKTLLHRPSGNQIICKGLDEPEKIKSIKGITGMWVEETTEFSTDELDQLDLRIRGEKPNYVQFLYSFNPISEDNPVVKRFVLDKLPPNTITVHSTFQDNFFLSEEDKQVLLSLKERNPLYYDVYCLGIPGVVDKSGKFLYSFNAKNQVVKDLPLSDLLPIWITFDFNIDPMTVTIAQRPHMKQMNCLKNIQLNDSDIYAMCDRIRSDYPNRHYIVTGDASGHNRTGIVRGKSSYWKVIREELALKDHQIQVRSINLGLIESRVLCNAVNQSVDVFFDEDGCKQLINDCKYAKVDERGVLEKDRNKQKNDFLDGLRYLLDANWADFLNRPKKYK